ncbi:SDR family oxidoreductase [Aquisalimonas sp.]|uniref:SDR family NAD(P)-dependent oxidoreductase n=1 Tax=unclassified Aquisalimonas TaxID=2644645 RepID=UPI0025B9E891|nr:SDR family oxidoreductase [Aquisalimonas sp.]
MEQPVYIVTGSSAGIGQACAERLARARARIVINYASRQAEAEAVGRQCRALGGDAIVMQADVADDVQCNQLVQAAVDAWGRVDGLVNNAGTTRFARHHDLDALQAEDFHAIFDVNVIGAYQMTRAVAPVMEVQGRGSVVNISSIAGLRGVGSSIAYAASKGALNTMTLSLARALGPAIRVNAVCPGFVETGWLKAGLGDAYEKQRAAHVATNPLQDVVQPDDVAEMVEWLLTGAPKTTGEAILVDGGMHLGAGGGRR